MIITLVVAVSLLARATDAFPVIGVIDYYGLERVSADELRDALQISEGDAPPPSKEEAIGRLEALPGVAAAQLTFVCCEADKTILYVGLREEDAPVVEFRPTPKGSARLPDKILKDGAAKDKALTPAVLKGEIGEDRSEGHALSENADLRAIQQRFIQYAADDLDGLRTVLRTSPDPSHRALAAEIMGYAPNKRTVVKALVDGMRDPAPEVRNNCMRALAAMVEFGRRSPREKIVIPPEPFVELLLSLEWSDRNKAAAALRILTDNRDAVALTLLRQRARGALEEMARWTSAAHAHDAFVLLGRINNIPERDIRERWNLDRDKRQF